MYMYKSETCEVVISLKVTYLTPTQSPDNGYVYLWLLSATISVHVKILIIICDLFSFLMVFPHPFLCTSSYN